MSDFVVGVGAAGGATDEAGDGEAPPGLAGDCADRFAALQLKRATINKEARRDINGPRP